MENVTFPPHTAVRPLLTLYLEKHWKGLLLSTHVVLYSDFRYSGYDGDADSCLQPSVLSPQSHPHPAARSEHLRWARDRLLQSSTSNSEP